MKKILNTSKRTYMHTIIEDGNPVQYRAEPNQIVSVPDEVAALWLRSPEIQAVDNGSEEKDAEIARLKKELEKANGGKGKEDATQSPDQDHEVAALRERAKELKIKGYAQAKPETLRAKIAEFDNQNENNEVVTGDEVA